MEWLEVMQQRHSVRQYTDRKIDSELQKKLIEYVDNLNNESSLHMQLFFDEPTCFESALAHYGKFSNVNNYLAVVGEKNNNLEELAGYYGEKFVLYAQSIGLNTCFVGLTHGKSKAVIKDHEKEVIIICLGYGTNQGVPHKSKPMQALYIIKGATPDWFIKGMQGAMLAPTAMNQQKFIISYDDKDLKAEIKGFGFFSKVDLGAVKCNFELASGRSFIKHG